MIDLLKIDELRAVFAHEIGHLCNRDLNRGLFFGWIPICASDICIKGGEIITNIVTNSLKDQYKIMGLQELIIDKNSTIPSLYEELPINEFGKNYYEFVGDNYIQNKVLERIEMIHSKPKKSLLTEMITVSFGILLASIGMF